MTSVARSATGAPRSCRRAPRNDARSPRRGFGGKVDAGAASPAPAFFPSHVTLREGVAGPDRDYLRRRPRFSLRAMESPLVPDIVSPAYGPIKVQCSPCVRVCAEMGSFSVVLSGFSGGDCCDDGDPNGTYTLDPIEAIEARPRWRGA